VDSELVFLTGLYRREAELYQKLKELALEQRNCVEKGNFPVLDEIVQRRQQIMSEVDKLEEEINRCKAGLVARLGGGQITFSALQKYFGDYSTVPLGETLKAITDCIKEIQSLDSDSTGRLQQLVSTLKGHMQQVHEASEAVKAYRPANPKDARYIDKRR
jgi:hypothetical protein